MKLGITLCLMTMSHVFRAYNILYFTIHIIIYINNYFNRNIKFNMNISISICSLSDLNFYFIRYS